MISFRRMIVDDIEQYLESGIMQPGDGRAKFVECTLLSVALFGGEI